MTAPGAEAKATSSEGATAGVRRVAVVDVWLPTSQLIQEGVCTSPLTLDGRTLGELDDWHEAPGAVLQSDRLTRGRGPDAG
ncbi:MAG: hypothetical protein ACRDNF_02265 [Streptosporangiaceae bacterium]